MKRKLAKVDSAKVEQTFGNILVNEFTGFQKEAYYYSAQLKEYKDMLSDPDKMVQKDLTLLNKQPAFTNFMKQNSQLASLFRLPIITVHHKPWPGCKLVPWCSSRYYTTENNLRYE